jgi:hypothetical protein
MQLPKNAQSGRFLRFNAMKNPAGIVSASAGLGGRGDWIFRLGCGLLALCAAQALACAARPLKASHREPFHALRRSGLQIQAYETAHKKAIQRTAFFVWSG